MNQTRYTAPDQLCICIDGIGHEEYQGRLYHQYQRDPIHFTDILQLLKRMEHVYDWLNYPEASTGSRSFRAISMTEEMEKEKETWNVNEHYEGLDNKGKLATFIIHVQYRQNATWQGKIVWAESKQSTHFRSALEMLKLMDSAVERADVDNEEMNNQEIGGE